LGVPDVENYLAEADSALRLAAGAADWADRRAYHEIADAWLRLASAMAYFGDRQAPAEALVHEPAE
jgi:hypothetical protein